MSIQSNINSIIGSGGTAAYLMKDLRFKKEVQESTNPDKIANKMLKAQKSYGKALDKSEAKFAKRHPDYKAPNGDYTPAGADDDGYVDFAADFNNYIDRNYEDSLKKRQAEVKLSNEAMKAYQTIYGNRGGLV